MLRLKNEIHYRFNYIYILRRQYPGAFFMTLLGMQPGLSPVSVHEIHTIHF